MVGRGVARCGQYVGGAHGWVPLAWGL